MADGDESTNIEQGLPLEAFAERILSLARSRYPEAKIEFIDRDAFGLSVAWPDGSAGTAHLDNVWRNYQLTAGGDSCEEEVTRFLQLFRQPDESQSRESIVALVRSVETLQSFRKPKEDPTPKNTVVFRPLVADLATVIADLPDSIEFLMEDDLGRWDATKQEIFAQALENVLGSLEIQRHGEGPLYMLTAGGNYEASLLLHMNLWRQLSEDVAGSLIASVPCRDLLLFSGTEEEGGLEALRERTASMFRKGSYNLSTAILRFTGEGWDVHG